MPSCRQIWKGITVRDLDDRISFGARIGGATRETIADPAVRAEINAVFEDRGMIVFEDVEPTSAMQVELSRAFGPLKDHPTRPPRATPRQATPRTA